MSLYLVWFLLFALNLIVIPFSISPFEAPKVIIAEIIIDLLLLLKIINFKKFQLKHLWTSQTILLGILLFLSLDQLLLFRLPQSFWGNPFRLQGVFLLWHLMIFSFISKDIVMSRIHKIYNYLSLIFLFLGTIILGIDQNNRAFGTLGEPNALAATVLFVFPFAYWKGRKFTKLLMTLLAFTIIILSGSRAGLIGLSIEMLFIVLTTYVKISHSKAVIISFFIILLTLTLPLIETSGWFENRGQIWQTAIYAGLQSPILGHGFGNIQDPIHKSAISLNNLVQYQVVDSAHNFILDFWIQGGIVGVILIILLIFLSFQRLIRHKKVLEITAFLGIITAMLFNPVSVVVLLGFWWLIGQDLPS